jgi:hypothetical protein
MKPKLEIVVLTYESAGVPHLAALEASNPGTLVHVRGGPDEANEALRVEAWRNCDRNMRRWWVENRETCAAGAVLFLEWDVLVTRSLEGELDLLDGSAGMAVANVFGPLGTGRRFAPFRETVRLPAEIRHLAAAAVPTGVVGLTRAALDALADERWDALYAADVFAELRLPTVVRACGFQVVRQPLWERAGTTPFTPEAGASGIFHPVKTRA